MERNLTTMINEDNPRSIQPKQDQPRSNQGKLNKNRSLALIALALFHTNINISDHIDLASLTLFLETGYACLSHFLGKFHTKHNQSLFETLPKLVSRHT